MLLIPTQLVVTLFLLLFFVRLLTDERPWTSSRLTFAFVILLFAFHGLINALVWAYGMTNLRPLLPIVAAILPVLTWYAFSTLASSSRLFSWVMLLRMVPPIAVIIGVFVFPPVVDVLIILQFIAYGTALLWLASAGPDTFQETVLHRSFSAMRAAQLTGALLIINAAIDLGIIVDFQLTGGKNFFDILSIVSILILMGLGIAVFVGIDAGKNDDSDEEELVGLAVIANPDDDKEIVARVDNFLRESKIYTDPDLSLSRLAKKLGLAPRQISSAINRRNGTNVSQYINSFRLNEACHLMRTTKDTITNIHYDSGFLTKSNFNREFKRKFGCSPTDWRKNEISNGA